MNRGEFIEKARRAHGDRYDYSKVEYKNNKTKVCIICAEHGEFWQTPNAHLKGNKCPKCAVIDRSNLRRKGGDAFINEARIMHGDMYDYSNVDYKNVNTKVCIICPEHGEFWQTPKLHLSGCGCPKCSYYDRGLRQKKNLEDFIEDAVKVHGDRYDYSKVDYKNAFTDIEIICPQHGVFITKPNWHLSGRGCPICNISHLERDVMNVLDKIKMDYVYQYKNNDILGKQSLDFFLPKYKIGIECQGKQHFGIGGWGIDDNDMSLQKIMDLDVLKYNKCKDNGIKIVYILDEKLEEICNNLIFYMDKTTMLIKNLEEYLINYD